MIVAGALVPLRLDAVARIAWTPGLLSVTGTRNAPAASATVSLEPDPVPPVMICTRLPRWAVPETTICAEAVTPPSDGEVIKGGPGGRGATVPLTLNGAETSP